MKKVIKILKTATYTAIYPIANEKGSVPVIHIAVTGLIMFMIYSIYMAVKYV